MVTTNTIIGKQIPPDTKQYFKIIRWICFCSDFDEHLFAYVSKRFEEKEITWKEISTNFFPIFLLNFFIHCIESFNWKHIKWNATKTFWVRFILEPKYQFSHFQREGTRGSACCSLRNVTKFQEILVFIEVAPWITRDI